MKKGFLPYIDYDASEVSGESLFALWERGESGQMPAPLSVRQPRYRRLIIELVKRHHPSLHATVLSIGAGNGFTEANLVSAGFDVVATDCSEIALEYCRQKGVKTVHYEFPNQSPSGLNQFDVIYCDGLLGHLWQPERGYTHCWTRFAEFAKFRSLLILSNDLADTDNGPTLRVVGAPEASFFRPPAGWFAQDAMASHFWTFEEVRVLRYMRRGLLRRREILLLRYSLMDKGKE